MMEAVTALLGTRPLFDGGAILGAGERLLVPASAAGKTGSVLVRTRGIKQYFNENRGMDTLN